MSDPQPLTFGIQTLGLPWPELRESWLRYEADGWDSLWIPDHLSTPGGETGPFLDAWVALAALANLTSRVRIGVLVSSNTFRHPSMLAKQAVTVDHLSNGRLVLGFGAGWYAWEHEAFGIDFPPTGLRVSQYGEALELLDTFLRNDVTSFAGEHYTLRDAPNRPPPVHGPGATRPRWCGRSVTSRRGPVSGPGNRRTPSPIGSSNTAPLGSPISSSTRRFPSPSTRRGASPWNCCPNSGVLSAGCLYLTHQHR